MLSMKIALNLSLHCFTRGAIQIFAHPIEDAVHEATRFSATESFCQLDAFID